MKKYDDCLGTRHITNEGYEIEIIEYNGYKDCKVLFENGHIKSTNIQQIKNGQIRNEYHPSCQGVGYIGVGIYSSINDVRCYEIWSGVIKRAYNLRLKEKNPSYEKATMCKEWHNFQVFAEWYYNHYNSETIRDWHLDKDILVKGNKIYSPETCCFVPQEVNTLFVSRKNDRGCLPIGVRKICSSYIARLNKCNKSFYLGTFTTVEEAFEAYKLTKEAYIKEIADKYKNKITDVVYQTLYNYMVEIND